MPRRKQAKTIDPPLMNYLIMKKIGELNKLDFADRVEAARCYRMWVRYEEGHQRSYTLPSGKRMQVNGKEQIEIS